MKQDWEIKRLSEIGKVYNGNSINEKVKKDNYADLDDGLPFIATKDISYESVIDYDNGIKIPFEEKSSFKTAPKNTVFICAEGGSAGRKIGFTNQEVCFGNKLFALATNKNIESRYVYYYYFSETFQKHFAVELAGIIGGVSMNKFKDLEIPLPPLPEQQRIVAILDEVFDAIAKAKANAEQNLKNAKELFESYLKKIFSEGTILSTIGDQILLQRGFDITKEQQQKGKVPVVSSGGVKSFHDKAMVHAPGIVIGRKGTLGKVFYLEKDFWPHDTTLWVKDFKENDPRFVYYFFIGLDVKSLNSGAANPALNRNQVHPIKVQWYSKHLQQEIVQKLDRLSVETKKLEVIYQQKINDLEELKKSVLQRAFNGELKTSNSIAV